VKLSNDVGQISQRPTLVAMATKFETKFATAQLLYNHHDSCAYYAIFGVALLHDMRQILPRPTQLPWPRNLRQSRL